MRRTKSAALAPLAAGAAVVIVMSVISMIVSPDHQGSADAAPPPAAALSSDHKVVVPQLPDAPRSPRSEPTQRPRPEVPPSGDTAANPTAPAPDGQRRPGRSEGGPAHRTPQPEATGAPVPPPAGPNTPVGPAGDLRSYGAKCDGSTNDREALQRAVTDMTAQRGTVTVPGVCRILTTGNTASISLDGPVTIRGTAANSALTLDADQAGAFRKLFDVHGDNVTLQSLTLKRVSDSYGIMLMLHGPAGFTLDNVVLDGQKNVYGANTFHGIGIWGGSGTLSNARMLGSTIKNTDFGLFQDSSVTDTTDGFTVDRSTFTGNFSDDLEFNSPSGKMVNVKVTNSRFSNNRARADQTGAGFGVGLANVQHATIQGNTFDGYTLDPVHIEDRSAFVLVDDNKFANSFTAPLNYASHVFVVSGSHDITITNNTFDTTANANRIDCVYAGPGGGAAVSNVTVRGNTFKLRPNAKAIGNYGVPNLTDVENTIIQLP